MAKPLQRVLKWKPEVEAAIKNAEAKTGIGVPAALVLAVIHAESSGIPTARSHVNAYGLMQLMPATAKGLGVDRTVPADNIKGGVLYLAKQIRAFGKVELAVAAYNAGPGNVRKYKGIPPFKETQRYVKKVLAMIEIYR